jgi:hypothetical protein
VPEGIHGKVTEAFINSEGEFQKAIVRIEKMNQPLGNEVNQ